MKSFSRIALEEHLYKKLPITRLEAITLYGVNDLLSAIRRLRNSGLKIERSVITQEQALKRLQKVIKCSPPKGTPFKELKTSEYRLVK